MPELNLTFNTGNIPLADINDALALEYGYQEIIDGAPNPETKAAFNKRHIGRIIREAYQRQKKVAAAKAATDAIPDVPEFT